MYVHMKVLNTGTKHVHQIPQKSFRPGEKKDCIFEKWAGMDKQKRYLS
jgi:hypothetical protein